MIEALRQHKKTSSAVLILLSLELASLENVTKKWIADNVFPWEPKLAKQAISLLEKVGMIDNNLKIVYEGWDCSNINTQEEAVAEEDKWAIAYGWKTYKTYLSFKPILVSLAKQKNMSASDYFTSLMSEIKKDLWWKDKITHDMCLRKLSFLSEKFGHKIKPRLSGMSSIEHIF